VGNEHKVVHPFCAGRKPTGAANRHERVRKAAKYAACACPAKGDAAIHVERAAPCDHKMVLLVWADWAAAECRVNSSVAASDPLGACSTMTLTLPFFPHSVGKSLADMPELMEGCSLLPSDKSWMMHPDPSLFGMTPSSEVQNGPISDSRESRV
jgi:hypothetical protein